MDKRDTGYPPSPPLNPPHSLQSPLNILNPQGRIRYMVPRQVPKARWRQDVEGGGRRSGGGGGRGGGVSVTKTRERSRFLKYSLVNSLYCLGPRIVAVPPRSQHEGDAE